MEEQLRTDSFLNRLLDRIIAKLSECSSTLIVICATVIVLVGSIPVVYLFAKIFGVTYTVFLFLLSALLPLILTPPIISILIRFTKHLKYYKEHLEQEIDKNKTKDIMLYEQARFALMGEMIANISHQWKQPLNTIGLSIVKARTSEKKDTDIDTCFDTVEDNIRHLASTIDDFMSFFDQRTHMEVRDIDDIVKEINSIIYTQISNENIEMIVDIDKSCENILVASSISQVILNLLNNAKDAFLGDIKNKKIILKFICDNGSLKLLCFDNGNGIKQEIKDKIFNPYFTTKAKTQGTGIGLYMSKQIINNFFNGTIEVLEKHKFPKEFMDMKTCFSISIPYSKNCKLKDEV